MAVLFFVIPLVSYTGYPHDHLWDHVTRRDGLYLYYPDVLRTPWSTL